MIWRMVANIFMERRGSRSRMDDHAFFSFPTIVFCENHIVRNIRRLVRRLGDRRLVRRLGRRLDPRLDPRLVRRLDPRLDHRLGLRPWSRYFELIIIATIATSINSILLHKIPPVRSGWFIFILSPKTFSHTRCVFLTFFLLLPVQIIEKFLHFQHLSPFSLFFAQPWHTFFGWKKNF